MVEQFGCVIQIMTGRWLSRVDFAAYLVSKGTETRPAVWPSSWRRQPRVRVTPFYPVRYYRTGHFITPPRTHHCPWLLQGSMPLDIAEAVYFWRPAHLSPAVRRSMAGVLYAGPAADAVAHPDVNDQ